MEVTIFGTVVDVATMLAARLLVAAIGAAGAWLLSKLAKTQKLKNIEKGVALVTQAAQTTVLELQQTVVGPIKESKGKLPEDVIEALADDLKRMTKEKLSPAVIELLVGAGIDIEALIQGVGEKTVLYLPHSEDAEEQPAEEPKPPDVETGNTEYAG